MDSGRNGLAFVISAPSGTGKTCVCRGVVKRDPRVVFSVSHTTRPMRPREREGIDYRFVSEPEFRRLVDAGAFLEFAEYNGRLYGTSWAVLEEPLAKGLDVLLEIEVQGARQVRERRPQSKLIFLLPPSFEVLERRLRQRESDSPATIKKRLAIASQELGAARWFDHLVVNDRLQEAVEGVLAIVHAAREGKGGALDERFGREAARARLDPSLASRVFG
jgi:guanylate kinase